MFVVERQRISCVFEKAIEALNSDLVAAYTALCNIYLLSVVVCGRVGVRLVTGFFLCVCACVDLYQEHIEHFCGSGFNC